MPRLRKYVSRDGYYIADYLHGVGNCIWQIGDAGEGYLRARGITRHGDHISSAERNELRRLGYIWFTNESSPRTGAETPTDPRTEVGQLASCLKRWARLGGVASLTSILYGRSDDHRDECFSEGFLNWLENLDISISLHDFDRLSSPDFEELADRNLSRLNSPLHRELGLQGEIHVLWQLSRVVGIAAEQVRGNSICPEAWQENRQPVLHRLFAILNARTGSPASGIGARRPRSTLERLPFLRWDVDFQQVVVVLPEQAVPEDVSTITWSVEPGGCEPPRIGVAGRGRRLAEAVSHALRPEPAYRVGLTAIRTSQGRTESHRLRIQLPDAAAPAVLFQIDGTLLPCEGGDEQPAGEYLALIRRDRRAEVFHARGIDQLEEFPFSPAGWKGWEGCRRGPDGGRRRVLPHTATRQFTVPNSLPCALCTVSAYASSRGASPSSPKSRLVYP